MSPDTGVPRGPGGGEGSRGLRLALMFQQERSVQENQGSEIRGPGNWGGEALMGWTGLRHQFRGETRGQKVLEHQIHKGQEKRGHFRKTLTDEGAGLENRSKAGSRPRGLKSWGEGAAGGLRGGYAPKQGAVHGVQRISGAQRQDNF